MRGEDSKRPWPVVGAWKDLARANRPHCLQACPDIMHHTQPQLSREASPFAAIARALIMMHLPFFLLSPSYSTLDRDSSRDDVTARIPEILPRPPQLP